MISLVGDWLAGGISGEESVESFVVHRKNQPFSLTVTKDMFVGNRILFERCDCTVGVLQEVSYHTDEFWKESFAGERVKKRLF